MVGLRIGAVLSIGTELEGRVRVSVASRNKKSISEDSICVSELLGIVDSIS